jgi:hypothetical protein
MINNTDLEKIKSVMETMVQLELSLSDLYEQCAVVSKDDETFWKGLSRVEVRHSEIIKQIIGLITEKREHFEVGRQFNIIALKTMISGIVENTKRISQGTVDRKKLFILARDVEQSILESNYSGIVKTNNTEYQTMMKLIQMQTHEHKGIILKAADDIKAKS